jgi:hypothetical protein
MSPEFLETMSPKEDKLWSINGCLKNFFMNIFYVKEQLKNVCLYEPRSCMLFVNGADDDATACAFSRGVGKLTEEPKKPLVEDCPI